MIKNLFAKGKIPDSLPKDMQVVINKLKKSKNKEDCLKKAYDILSKKYRGYRVKTYTRFFDLFQSDLNKIWAKKDFLHCTTMNYLMRILLVKSGFFKDKDTKIKFSLVWYISPHQYLNVRLNKKSVNIDLWGKAYGIKFGDYAHGFH